MPSTPPSTGHVRAAVGRVELRLPAADLETLRTVARANDRPIAAEARRAIRAHLAREQDATPSTSATP